MEKYLFSAADNAFYPYSLEENYRDAGSWPESGVDVGEDVFYSFSGATPVGKVRAADDEGKPCWVEAPPLTEEEVTASFTAQKNTLRAEADTRIAPLKDAMSGGYIDDADKLSLAAWEKYRYALTKVEIENPVWPEKPE